MKQKKKECHFLKFKFRPMFTEPARGKELRREIIPSPRRLLLPAQRFALTGCLPLMAPFSDTEGCHSLKRAKVVLDLSAWQKKT